MKLLDETHARRMATEATGAAAATTATESERAATHAGFTLAFVP
jgi:hypothetical protein